MLIISRTPLRISFVGGGTDYPVFFHEHSGAVLGTTIDQYTHISIKTLKGAFFEHNIRVAYSKTELVKMIQDIEHPSVRESLSFMKVAGNLDIHIFSDLPAKTGLGSSSSFTVGFLNALYALQGKRVSKQQLAEEACHVEQQLIKERVGSQDQFHAAFGGFNVIEFYPSHIKVRPLVISRERKEFLENHLMIFYTGLTRVASDIVKEQIENTQKNHNTAYLKEMLNMVHEGEEILTEAPIEEMAKAFGALLHKGWELKKKLSNKVSTGLIDNAYEAAMKAGAFGGKLCGAGGGGFLLFIVPSHAQANVREALKGLLEVKFRFENEGSNIIYIKD